MSYLVNGRNEETNIFQIRREIFLFWFIDQNVILNISCHHHQHEDVVILPIS